MVQLKDIYPPAQSSAGATLWRQAGSNVGLVGSRDLDQDGNEGHFPVVSPKLALPQSNLPSGSWEEKAIFPSPGVAILAMPGAAVQVWPI